jgi:Domain of unknown function (DUF4432)
VLAEGGHIAEILDKGSGVNPLWTPPWPSIEPSTYDRARHPEYGDDAESKLLAGIMGHNLCLDLFGPPSEAEAAAGLTVHGEASVVTYDIASDAQEITARAELPMAGLRFERRLSLRAGSRALRIAETVENLASHDRPIAWTQHVTLGPPFLVPGLTEFRAPAIRSQNVCPGFSTHLMDPEREQAWFMAYSPQSNLLFGYIWKRADFPWLGIWEEDHGRQQPPWNGRTLTRGMEFGVSPIPESRRAMIDRGTLFGAPAYRWIAAKETLRVEYCAFLAPAERIPESAPGNFT